MDEYIQKYLDGDLTEAEATLFARALANDPALDARLRSLEKMLSVVAQDPGEEPSAAFSEGVMQRVRTEAAAAGANDESRSPFFSWFPGGGRAWGMRLAWTAAFTVVFMIGYMVAAPNEDEAVSIPVPVLTSSTAEVAAPPSTLRLVRLVYVPQNENVERVSVAGTFNGWNPAITAMQKQGQAWVVLMTLPPQSYEYMFVEDGQRWVTDPLAVQTRDDGFGRENAVLDLTM